MNKLATFCQRGIILFSCFLLFGFMNSHATCIISGPVNVCENKTANYTVTPTGNYTYQWNVLGSGTIIGTGPSATVAWTSPGTGTITIVIKDSLLNVVCTGSLSVTIHPNPKPVITPSYVAGCGKGKGGSPQGRDDECFVACDSTTIQYSVPFQAGHFYTWTVTGAATYSSAANVLTVFWTGIGTGSITVKDSNSFGCVGIKEVCVKIVGKPQASFYTLPGLTGLVVNACKLQTIQFINTSSPGAGSPLATYSWDFGDGGFDFQTAPSNGNTSHAYTNPGTYQVMFIAENECGCKDTAYVTVVVANDIGPSIYCISTVCPGNVVTYHTNAQCGNWLWSVSGGTPLNALTDSTLTVQWGSTGPGILTLSVNCPGFCNAPTSVFVPIISTNATISGPSQVCLNDCYTYHISCDIPIDSIKWSFPAGVTVISDSINVHEVRVCFYSATISGNITATYFHKTNGSTQELNCGGQSVKPVAVRPQMFISGNNTYCLNNPFLFNLFPPSGGNIYWTIANSGGTVLTSATLPATSSYGGICNFGAGNFIVTANDLSGNYCNGPQSINIKVNPIPPPPDTIIGPLYVCPNNAYTYTAIPTASNFAIGWQVTNGAPSQGIGNTISVTWGPSGPYSLSAVQIDVATGCKSTPISISVNSLLPMTPTVITGPTTVCANSTNIVYSTSTLGDDFEWSINTPLAGSIMSGNHTNSVNVQWNNYIGTAWLVVKRMVCNTTRKDSILINIGSPPTPTITAPTSTCQGSTIIVSSSGAASYSWNFGDGGTATGTPANHIYNSPGNFIITLTATYGGSCPGSSTVTKPISIHPKPNVSISTPNPNQFCSAPVLTTMYVAAPASGVSYVWSPSSTTGTSYTATSTGSYYVVGTNSFGCKDTSNVITVSIISCTPCTPAAYTLTYNRHRLGCSKDSFVATFSAGVINLSWDFDDIYNPGGASGTPVTHTFTEPGYYRVKLCADVPDAAGTGYCPVCMFKVDTIKYVPDFFDSLYCTNTSPDSVKVKFVNTTKVLTGYPVPSYSWLIMPGSYTSTAVSPIRNLAPGTYTVTLTVNGICSKTKTIVVPPLAKAIFTVVDSVCVGKPVLFSNTSTGTIVSSLWKFGDGSTSLIFSPLRTYTSAGIYNVVLSVVNALGCKDTLKKPITVLPNTLSGIIIPGGPLKFCEGDSLQLTCVASGGYPAYNYLWNTLQSTPVIWAQQTANYTVDLTDSKGCFYKTPKISVLVKSKPKPKIFGPKVLCLNQQYNYYVNYPNIAGAVISWTIDGSFYSNGSSIPYFANPLGNHTIVVDVQSPDTCYGSDTLIVFVNPNPNVSIISNPVLCAGTQNLLVATSTSTNLIGYQWSNGQTNDSIYTGIPKVYTVTAIDSNGCKADASVIVNPLPDLCGLMIGCYEICDTVTQLVWYAPKGYASYQWYFNGVPLPWAVSDTIHLQLYKDGEYKVEITTAAGCSIMSEPIDITFVKCGGCKFNATLNITCGPVSGAGNQTYNLTFTVNNSLGAGAGISIYSSDGTVTSVSPGTLAAGTNTVTAVFEDIPPVTGSACFTISIYTQTEKCDTTICKPLPECQNKNCSLSTKLNRIRCAGTDGSGNPQYYLCIDVNWGGSNGSTLTLTTASGSFVPNPVTVNSGLQTLCYTYTDLPPVNTFITLYSNVFDPVTGLVCRDSLKFEYKPCPKDSCSVGVYGECAHCHEMEGGVWTYDVDLTVFNPFANNATVSILPIAAGTFGPITPNPVPPGMQTVSTVFTDLAPANSIICFRILLTDVVTNMSCWKDICLALPPCDSNASVLYNVEESFSLVMYPNPASDHTNLRYQFLHPSDDMQIVVTDVNGRTIQTVVPADFAGETVLNTGEWYQGVYFVKVMKDGRNIGTSKLVIVR